MKAFITGGTGFIGSHLIRMLTENRYQVVVATRNPDRHSAKEAESDDLALHPVRYVELREDMSDDLQDCNVVVNLAGETLFGKRWTPRVKKRLYDSRIETTRSLVSGIQKLDRKPEVLLSASGVNYYGDSGDEKVTESQGPGSGFLTEICKKWEKEAQKAEKLGVRVVNHRFGVALGTDGGALATMLTVFKSFVGGSIGPGHQYFPWIHVGDLCRALHFAAASEKVEGPVNTTSPNPVTMDEFSKSLGKVLSRPSFFYVPEMAVRMALGEAASLVTTSLRVIPEKLEKLGFTFNYPTVDQALTDLLKD